DQRLHAGVAPDRTQVDVLVELEADLQQQPTLQHAGRDVRVPDRAEIESVEAAHLVERALRQYLARPEIPVAAEVVLHGVDLEAASDGLHHLETLADALGAGAVARDHADPVG